MSLPAQHIFHPVEGAVLDLQSLQAISESLDRHLEFLLSTVWPGAHGLVLEGLELEGEWSPNGPPGAKRPDSRSAEAIVSPGKALVTGRDGRRHLISVDEPLRVRWPTQAGAAVDGVLVLVPRVEAARSGQVAVARQLVSAILGFVRPDQAHQPFLLPLAASVGNGQDWATDLQRVWQPEHPAVRILLKKFEQLEHLVWKAEPEGSVWDRHVLGRNWVRYQTVAASALQAARLVLQSRASTTRDRVRLLAGLHDQLHNSVEAAANALLQLIGPPEGAGPYRVVGSKRAE